MTETADYIISKMVELSREISQTMFVQDIALYAAMVFGAIAMIGLVCVVLNKFAYSDWPIYFLLMGGLLCVCAVGAYVMSAYDLHFMYEQMNGLKTAYEALYGPIPPGVL